ncbi:MAG: mechanosensitive ion channel [Xanthomonadales bacterium]|nr:mechanosensitive ion channel [Xanthomonadales bacterium]
MQYANELSEQLLLLFSETAVLRQLIIVLLLLLLARFAAWKLEPKLEARIRAIESPDRRRLRQFAILLRRLSWALFVLFGSLALVLINLTHWPGSSYLISTSVLLALAWLVIRLLSQVIESRLLGRLVAILVWSYVALHMTGLTSEAVVFLDALGFSVGNFRISAWLIVKVLVLMGVLLWLSISLGDFLDKQLQQSEDLTPSLRVLIGKVVKISLIVMATVLGLSSLGIDLTIFTVFSGAIGVGLGFGLQKVVSNFISGIIILMDRSIKPGDTISLGETFGWIRELRARFVSVVTRDGREYLIPNEDFITQQVINWSFSDELVRLDVPFGVSYNSDPHEVTALAIAAAESCRRVHRDMKPVCWLTGFGDSSLDFVLRFWITDPREGLTNIRGQVLLALWDTFKENNVAIPFPHREIIMRTPVEVKGLSAEEPKQGD